MFEKFDASRSVFKKPQFLPFSGPTSSNPLRLFVFASMQGTDEGHFNNLTLPSSSSGSGGGDSEGGHRGQDGGGGGEAKGSGGDPIWTFGNPFHWKHCSAPGCKEGNTVLTRLAPSSETQIQVIEWNMMDMKKFYPLSMLSSFFIRCVLYPLTLVKTKIQIQEKANVYNGTIDCFRKIYNAEGLKGLYKGFWISAFQIISGVFYVSTYEGVRHSLYLRGFKDNHIRALIAGGCASVVGQTIIVPFDVISQHMMIVGMRQNNLPGGNVYNPLGIQYEGRTKLEITEAITKEIYVKDGVRGFYRGYFASLTTYVPNSALWWGFYQLYQDELIKLVPSGSSHLAVQCFSAMLGGWTTTIITNPLDVCRARLQVQRLPSFPKTFSMLWHEERYKIFTKGLSARMCQSGVFSTFIILGYESIKRFSINEDFRDVVRW